MGGRNVAAKLKGEEGYGLDFDSKRLPVITHEEILDRARREAAGEVIEDPHMEQDLEVIAILSAVNTAVTVMVLGFLYIIGRSRSGATLALKMMYPIDTWSGLHPTSDFIRLMGVTIAAGMIAVPMMLVVGKGVLKLHELIPLQTMILSVIIFVSILVFLSTGWIGMGVLIVGVVMGLMPPRLGIRRSHAMGIILMPIMILTFNNKYDVFGFL